MIYPSIFEDKIGFTRIRELISEYCLFEPGRKLVEQMRMMDSFEFIERELDLVEEFRQIEISEDDFPIHQFHDSREALQKATVEGTYLDVDEISGLAKSMESVRLIIQFIKADEEHKFPRLRELSGNVKLYPFVTDRIQHLLNKHGKIKDNASPELSQIRRTISAKQSSVSKQLQKILKKAQSEGWMDEDASATFRNDRPVLPLLATHKRRVGGLVHDESTTGKTVFVEPAEVVEMSNEIRELEYAERREIIKILQKFTEDIRPYIPELEQLHLFLADIDFIRARALFAIRVNAIRPELQAEPGFDWINAVHPLLYLTLKQAGRDVVPLSLSLDNEHRILLISGPNAGGKSVCLQTVGLLQYMCQCGMLVPVEEKSKFGVFTGIFIDIGDEQSIDNDLSTYSSHLVNMKHFIKNAEAGTLALIDEFGTGTEPMLGGAIAEAILEKITESGTFGILTTHYTNLKHFAASADGVVNGAMLFDNHRMQPLYELQVGKPGSSFAFEIARKIGLPEEVLKSASDKIGQDYVDFDKHLKDVLRDKKYWEGKRKKIRQSEKKLEELMSKYAEELSLSEKKRKTLINEAKLEAEQMLSGANRQIENTIREIKEANAEKEKTRKARGKLDHFKERIERDDKKRDEKIGKELRELKQREKELSHRRPDLRKKSEEKQASRETEKVDKVIGLGDFVKMKGQDMRGEVIQLSGKKCTVVFGHIKTTIKLDQLQKLTNQEAEASKPASGTKVKLGDWDVGKRRLRFKPEIDLRGKRADEAMQMVSGFIDEAIMVSASELRILHGKGDGILRQLIREFLGASNVVEWFGDEHMERGGSGITLVKL